MFVNWAQQQLENDFYRKIIRFRLHKIGSFFRSMIPSLVASESKRFDHRRPIQTLVSEKPSVQIEYGAAEDDFTVKRRINLQLVRNLNVCVSDYERSNTGSTCYVQVEHFDVIPILETDQNGARKGPGPLEGPTFVMAGLIE